MAARRQRCCPGDPGRGRVFCLFGFFLLVSFFFFSFSFSLPTVRGGGAAECPRPPHAAAAPSARPSERLKMAALAPRLL